MLDQRDRSNDPDKEEIAELEEMDSEIGEEQDAGTGGSAAGGVPADIDEAMEEMGIAPDEEGEELNIAGRIDRNERAE